MAWREELNVFFKTTSIKGFKRVFDSEANVIKYLWTISIIALFSVAGLQCYTIISNFLSYSTVTLMVQKNGDANEFPAVTICNQNPFSFQGEISYGEYLDHLNDNIVTKHEELLRKLLKSIDLDETEEIWLLFNNILSAKGFYTGLTPEEVGWHGHSFEKLVLDCSYFQYGGLLNVRKPCTKMANITVSHHPNFFNCYTFELIRDQQTVNILDITLILHNQLRRKEIESPYSFPKLYGAKVAVHQPGTFVDVEENGIEIPPGRSSTLQLIPEEIDRLPKPHGNCISKESSPYPNLVDLGGKSLKYNYQACLYACFQQELVKQCQCIDPNLLVYININDKKQRVCQKLTKNSSVEDVVQSVIDLNCTFTAIKDVHNCLKTCHPACSETKWDTRISYSLWPSQRELVSFYKTIGFLQRQDILEDYGIFLEVEKLEEQGRFTEAYQLLINSSNLQENVVRIKFINTGRDGYKKFLEVEKYNSADVVSKLGGLLNLWCGISAVIIIEVLEMIMRIISRQTIHTNKVSTIRN